jgi:hypothetical protein
MKHGLLRKQALAGIVGLLLLSCGGGGDTVPGETDAAVADKTGEPDLGWDGLATKDVDGGGPPADFVADQRLPDGEPLLDGQAEIGEDAPHPPADADGSSQPDAGTMCTEEGGFGCECANNSECLSGWCVETPDGYVCSMICVEECPPGWHCAMVQDFPDVVHACLPEHPKLCRPCALDQECQGMKVGTKVLCVDLGPQGAFCGGDCSENGSPCPAGYTCKSATSIEGVKAQQCVPDDGECDCSELAIEMGLSTTCYELNQHGKCLGKRACSESGLSDCDALIPAAEICNASDDDCNGVVDDDLVQEACDISNIFGTCKGSVLCVGGLPVCQGKEPTAEVCDGLDNNCDGTPDEGYTDCDGDGLADCIETDDDADGWPDGADNCPCKQNPTQDNYDVDAMGDACDPDDDNDGVPDDKDCEPTNPKVFPGVPETCNGLDDDCDGTVDEGSLDTDNDLIADCMDEDDDGDQFPDVMDNCPLGPNQDQKDTDGDNKGDACDPDDDNDGTPDGDDCGPTDKGVFPNAPEMCDCKDNDCDGKTDEIYPDTDKDGIADCCEDDPDGDGVPSGLDNCPLIKNPDQLNTDGDLNGDECDTDDDDDGIIDALDCAPKEAKAFPGAPEICDGVDNDCDGITDNNFADSDKDGVANCIDPDDDGDGVADKIDKCPFVADPLQIDTDKDGLGNACDGDDDGDGDFDLTDCQPLNPLINHSAPEFCNGSDDNCNGVADDPGAAGCILLFPDGDGDGFGVTGEELCLCEPEAPYVAYQGGDCDDASIAVNPVAVEVCNGKDDNCDKKNDPPGASGCTKYYQDTDGDGVGVAGPTQCLCKAAAPYNSTKTGDCAPDDPAVFPGNKEVCDDKDNDCDQEIDNVQPADCTNFYKDMDKDGYGLAASFICGCKPDVAQSFTATKSGDCDDKSAAVNPGTAEKCGDGLDNDCDGKKDEDCLPASIEPVFVSAGSSLKGATFGVTCGLGLFDASGVLVNQSGFAVQSGLLPMSVAKP